MKYGLTSLVLGKYPFVELSRSEYLEIKKAKKNLLNALFIEQKFDLVLDNYLEFETSLLDLTAKEMVRGAKDYSAFQTDTTLVNRRIINLLSSGRLYIDHSSHHLSNIFGKNSTMTANIKEEISRKYDENIGYRTMDALRNLVQHRGYPVHSLKYSINWIEQSGDVLFSLTPYISWTELKEEKKFKKAILNELKDLGEKIDIRPFLRGYVETIGMIHEKIRSELEQSIDGWEKTILKSIENYENILDKKKSIALAAVSHDEDGKRKEEIQLFRDFIEYRRKLVKKHFSLKNLSKRYVSNEILKKN